MTGLEILETGPLSLIQDLGRTGHLRSGVGVSGAADRRSLRLGNRLVGNSEDAAGVEILMGGLSLRAHQQITLAFTGAPRRRTSTAFLWGIRASSSRGPARWSAWITHPADYGRT